jgi:hypothetical protein
MSGYESEVIESERIEPAGDFLRRVAMIRVGGKGGLLFEETEYLPRPPAYYTGPNFRFRDYWVREVKRSGTERHSVYLEIVGTGRTLRIGRKAFERERARA